MSLQDFDVKEQIDDNLYRGVRKSDDRSVALKIIPMYNEADKFPYDKKMKFLQRLTQPECNPFVVCYYDSFWDPDERKYVIVMELVEGKTLKEFAEELRNRFPEDRVNYIMSLIGSDLAKGLKFTHSKGIVHNDITPDTIIIDKNNTPRIVDYEMASCSNKESKWMPAYCVSSKGADYTTAPESVDKGKRYAASDMWALGITLYMAISGDYPYSFSDRWQLPGRIKSYDPAKLDTSNDQLNDAVNGLLNKDMHRRLKPNDVITILEKVEKPNYTGDSRVSDIVKGN